MVVSLSKTGSEVNGLANVIALGMSFICGVFIPDTMLSASVKQVARFLPVYWYEQNNTILGTHTELSPLLLEKLKINSLTEWITIPLPGIFYVYKANCYTKKQKSGKT